VRTLAAAVLLLAACSSPPPAPPAPLAGQPIKPSPLQGFDVSAAEVGTRVILAGQPTPMGLANARDGGVKLVINLRPSSEQSYDERMVVTGLGMQYLEVPVTLRSLDDTKVAAFIEAMRGVQRQPESTSRVLVHCESGNRAAAMWAMYEIADGKLRDIDAVTRARKAGLTSSELVQFIGEWARRTGAQ
jgi:uncharacterized protein (TIGR01244 family)